MIRIVLLVVFSFAATASAAPKPNVVWILADDLGYGDLGFQGSEDIATPHLDALAAGGVRCTSGYSSHPFCSPMRAGLMTGRSQQRFGYVTTPLQAPEEWLAKCSHIADKKRRTYAAMVAAMDHGIGRVMAALEEAGVRERTMVFFLSDNGGPEKSNASDNGALRGQKGDVFEGGVRVPFVVSMPSVLKAGVRYEAPVSSLDVSGTTLALAGIDVAALKKFDGVNLIPYLKGEKRGVPHGSLFWRKADGESWAVRSGKWKLLRVSDFEPALFDLDADIAEANNLAKQHPDVVSALRADYSAWDADNMKSQLPSYGPYHEEMLEIYRAMIGR